MEPKASRATVTLERLRRALRLPRLSGWLSAVVLAICFGLTAVLVPLRLKLTGWIEAELVVASWWAIWGIALTVLCYRHALVEDDGPKAERLEKRAGRWNLGGWDMGTIDVGVESESPVLGCLATVVITIVLILAVWFFVEVIVPLLAVTMYLLIRGMLALALNRRHGCRGHLGRSLVWAWSCATLYTAPLAALVWVIHTVLAMTGPRGV